jgi:hypothetical protein
MSVPIEYPSSAGEPVPAPVRARGAVAGTAVASLAVVAGTALLGVAAGFIWIAMAPRPLLVITSHGAASLVNAESTAFISADGIYCLICLAGGAVSGLLGYVFAVRRYGPLAMAGVVAGAVAAAYLTRWIGEQAGLATFHHQLATLHTGARLRGSLRLGATGALAFWPLAASLVAGGLAALANPGKRSID